MRCWARFSGLNVALSGTDLRGPDANFQMTPSVRPLKWQLEQPCQPSLESRSEVDTVALGGRLKLPRELKNISAPTATTSAAEPGGAGAAVGMVPITRSVPRST